MNAHTTHRSPVRSAARATGRAGGARLGGSLLGGALLASGLLLAPAAAIAAPVAAEDTATDAANLCTVTDGTLSWGVKESFRSYISGSIANGEWDASDGATYETPEFTWTGGTGEFDPATGTGAVSFIGTVHFTGHSGALDLTLSNPTIEFGGDGEASLLLDSRSTDVSGALALDVKQEWLGDVTVPETIAPSDDAIALDAIPVTLTNGGVKAFADFYEAGDELDPITIDLAVSGCDAAAVPAAEPETAEPGVVVTEDAAASIPWLPIGIGAVALLVIGVTTGMLLGGRKKKPSEAASDPAQSAQPAQGPGAPGTDKLFPNE